MRKLHRLVVNVISDDLLHLYNFIAYYFIHHLLNGRQQTAEQSFLHLGMDPLALSSLLHSELLLEKLLLPKERRQF